MLQVKLSNSDWLNVSKITETEVFVSSTGNVECTSENLEKAKSIYPSYQFRDDEGSK